MQFLKSNSCLLAFDNSPSFSTGEKLGLFFADFLQNVDLNISPPRTQSRQIGSQEFGVDAINFSPDVELNLSYLSREDFRTDNLLGSIFRPSGVFISPFSGVRDYSFNTYLFFSNQQSSDLIDQIITNNSFSGVNVVAIGNCYLTNQNFSFAASQLPRASCGLISSNIYSQVLDSNYLQVPAINLESGTTGGAATIFLDPAQVSRIQTGNASGILRTWAATFQPSFENLQISNQNLVSAVVNKMDISLSIERENAYGFGSDHVSSRDIKYPIQASVSINGIVNDYLSGDYSSLMTNEQKYQIQIFNRDPQDAYLSGLSNAEISGVNKLDHLTKNRWLKFDNSILRQKKDSLAVGGFFEFAHQFDVSVTENRGMTFKQGEEKSIDDVFLHSNDFHKCISRDGYSPTHNPFLQYYETGCAITNLLSSDRKILLTRDNFVESAITCPYNIQIFCNSTSIYCNNISIYCNSN